MAGSFTASVSSGTEASEALPAEVAPDEHLDESTA